MKVSFFFCHIPYMYACIYLKLKLLIYLNIMSVWKICGKCMCHVNPSEMRSTKWVHKTCSFKNVLINYNIWLTFKNLYKFNLQNLTNKMMHYI